eukprot:scaffold3076_cov18-Tisochrysis_lutea.AAC.1
MWLCYIQEAIDPIVKEPTSSSERKKSASSFFADVSAEDAAKKESSQSAGGQQTDSLLLHPPGDYLPFTFPLGPVDDPSSFSKQNCLAGFLLATWSPQLAFASNQHVSSIWPAGKAAYMLVPACCCLRVAALHARNPFFKGAELGSCAAAQRSCVLGSTSAVAVDLALFMPGNWRWRLVGPAAVPRCGEAGGAGTGATMSQMMEQMMRDPEMQKM